MHQPQRKRMVAVGAINDTDIYRVEQIPPPPAKALAAQMWHVVDGMALSAAYAFTRLGGDALVCGRVGDDAKGQAMRRALADEGMDVSGLHTVPGSASSQVAVVIDAKGDRLVVPYHDPLADPSPDWLPVDQIARADLVHCDVRWPEGAAFALAQARQHGVPSMVDGDVAPVEILRQLVPLADYAVFSDAGLLRYTGCDDVRTALLAVAPGHGGHVGASCGADGYLWHEDGQIRHVPAPRVEVVDTLSAGDVFHGAFALAILEGKGIEAAARFACAAASLKCTRPGGRLGCPTRAQVDAMCTAQQAAAAHIAASPASTPSAAAH